MDLRKWEKSRKSIFGATQKNGGTLLDILIEMETHSKFDELVKVPILYLHSKPHFLIPGTTPTLSPSRSQCCSFNSQTASNKAQSDEDKAPPP
jgi:hypothetical protein